MRSSYIARLYASFFCAGQLCRYVVAMACGGRGRAFKKVHSLGSAGGSSIRASEAWDFVDTLFPIKRLCQNWRSLFLRNML
jgi:hypothetical protein